MSGILSRRKRRLQINKFILYAASHKNPVFDSHKILCELLPDQFIEYVDFEWNYFQFYHGNRDLTIERSPQNSSPLTFSDLPVDALEKVVGELSLVERLVLRKVSHGLSNLVDSTEVRCEVIAFTLGESYSILSFDNQSLQYEKSGDDEYRIMAEGMCRKEIKISEKNCNLTEIMMAEASTFLKNPKLKIGYFQFTTRSTESFSEFSGYLKSLDFKLVVSSLHIDSHEGFSLPVFQYLKPKTLEYIAIDAYNAPVTSFDEITETEQWKMAQNCRLAQFPRGFRMENMLHFKEINISRFAFTEENVIMIRDVLLKSAHLEVGCMEQYYFNDESDYDPAVSEKMINGVMSADPAYDSDTGRFSIQGSRDYFQIESIMCSLRLKLTITKISQN